MRADRLGKYELVHHLASGGMASVYLARISGPGGFERHVVLKTLRAGNADSTLVPMFLDEARLAAALHHQHIAQVFDVGSDGDTYFLAMEYVHGETLRRVIDTAVEHQRIVPLGFAITVLCAAAAGLHHAHERRTTAGLPLEIVHRDVTPSNVIVSYDGSIKLIDFGIAKAAERATITRDGFIKGKVGYMAPEQIRGYAVDRRSDVFALGVLAYELMTLRRAFTGASQFDTLERTVHSDLIPPTGVIADFPQELEDVIMTALEIDPDDRYPSADVFRRDLERVAQRLNLTIGEGAVLAVLDKLFGFRPEPWLTAPAIERDPEVTPVIAVPLIAAPGEHAFARGSGYYESLTDDLDDQVTSRVATVEPDDDAAPSLRWSPPPPTMTRIRPKRWPVFAILGACVIAAAVTALAIFGGTQSQRVAAATEPAPASPMPRPSAPAATQQVATTPARPPAPLPPAPMSTEVMLSVTTEPSGATVVLDGVRLGTTPFTGSVPARTKPAWLKVRRRGSSATKIRVSLERDVTWDVRLRPHP
ncbi:MAG: protein kinase [Deltaproteobacteria bacterium]|nr:protein kinase [Deltaproteobacteria bacterium]